MRKIFLIGLMICGWALNQSKAQSWSVEDLVIADSFEEIEHIFRMNNDTTYVINLWATWCGPCVREMPYFTELQRKHSEDKIKIILVSLDFEKYIESKLIPLLNDKDIKSEVIVLLDGNANKWIDKIDPTWSGVIPATLIYRGDQRQFYEKEFHSYEELKNNIQSLIN